MGRPAVTVQRSEAQIKKGHPLQDGLSYLVLDNDLLSHGETPHYHRRCIVSLLSSGWDQVVPMLYGRQAILLKSRSLLLQAASPRIRYVILAQYLRVLRTFGSQLVFPNCLGVIWSSLTGN